MLKQVRHIMMVTALLAQFALVRAQIAMPDTVCVGTTHKYQVNTPATPSTYTWKLDGVTQASTTNEISFTWNIPGTYVLTVQEHGNNGCDGDIRSGLIIVRPVPVPNAGPDIVLCFGKTAQLNGSGGTFYQWSPPVYLSNASIANPVVNPPGPGIYMYNLQVRDAFGCAAVKRDTVRVTILPPVKVFAGRDTSIAVNQPLQLTAVDVLNSGFTSYTWSPSFGLNNAGIQNPVALIDRDQVYVVTARTSDNCEATDDIRIRVFPKPEIYVPTAFSPNGDGTNDIFIPVYAGIKELKFFSVYNRFGETVFTTTSMLQGWNGIYKSREQGIGTFVWIVEAVDYKGQVIKQKGTVVLVK